MAADGLITVASSFGPEETADRLESEITARGMTVFARVDHAAGAARHDGIIVGDGSAPRHLG